MLVGERISRNSETTSERLMSVRMVSGDEEAHSSRCEYKPDEPSSSEKESLASSPSEEEVETRPFGQIYLKIILPRI